MSQVHLCPVCSGNGKKEASFYESTNSFSTSSDNKLVDCKGCGGKGWVTTNDDAFTFSTTHQCPCSCHQADWLGLDFTSNAGTSFTTDFCGNCGH